MKIGIIGCAWCAPADFKAAPNCDFWIAVNHSVRDFEARFVATVHPERAAEYAGHGSKVISTAFNRKLVDVVYDETPYRFGTSGLYAVGLALFLGAERVVLAGCPMDTGTHYYDTGVLNPLDDHRNVWRDMLPTLRGRVTSLSGWTRELLGSP